MNNPQRKVRKWLPFKNRSKKMKKRIIFPKQMYKFRFCKPDPKIHMKILESESSQNYAGQEQTGKTFDTQHLSL